jgi:hypothetical protein
MGRLDDIIERNKNPGKAHKAPGDAPASPEATAPASPAGEKSRLDQIIERNQNPRKHGRSGVTMGLVVAAFVFLILVLIVFTDLDDSPTAQAPEPTVAPSGEKRVDGVLLYREPMRTPRDGGFD